ncbi:MAG TPA: protein kinase, partial [Anaerolineales bacterium]|nr:protein kinase [Anaerolineales bacterium]
MSNDWVGKTLGKVQIETLIARGGMAEVYLGTHTTLERKVAVKIMRNPSEEHSDDLERFQREAKVVASLRHPNIVQVYDFDMVDNDPYLVMEYVDGPTLSTYLHFLHKEGKKLDLPHIARLLGSIASALQYAHNHKIVHRDIKPGNILLTSPSTKIENGKPLPDDFEPVLTDFGLIRFLDSARQTTTGVTAGTPAYMSPEQAQGQATDGQTDIYSLGIVLYEMLSGKLPFDGETTVSILLKHVNEPPPPIPGLSPRIKNVLDRALAKKKLDRFPSPADFAKAFNAAVDINPATMQFEALTSAGPSTVEMDALADTEMHVEANQPKRSNWMRIAITGGIALTAGAFLFFNGMPSFASNPEISTSTNSLTAPEPSMTNTFISTITPVPINLETSLVIHFQDENAIADQAFLEANRVPAAPAGNKYEVWLFNTSERISLGILSLDIDGKGRLIYTDEQGENLVAKYDQAEITLEPEDDTNPQPTSLVAYSFALPSEGTQHIRSLLSSFPSAPEKSALIQGLYADVQKINELAGEMDSAYASRNDTLTRQTAEAIMNLIVGPQSPDYKDWNGDGTIEDVSTGYGLDLNGSNLGYLGAIYTEADDAVISNNTSQPILTYGESLKASVQNLAQWTPQLRALVLEILDAPKNTDLKEQVTNVVLLADQMLNGVDSNGNGSIDSELGEGGAEFAYRYAYGMADMPLESTGLVAGIGTPTPPGGFYEPTTGSGGNGGGGSGGSGGSAAPTQKPGNPNPPGQEKTKKPQPTKKNNNNGN